MTSTNERAGDTCPLVYLHFLALTDERGQLIGISAPVPAALTTTPPPATTTSWPTCAPPVSGRWRTSASAAWTTTHATP
ncbi:MULTISPECIES: hypothetical protein [Streptomyces]|uniref:hypothetical protein n=1 Tax=Streptomyces TaxID=1883 RepID=UPI001F606916|nr:MULTISPECIES: hypothetical protein [Streptomyces]